MIISIALTMTMVSRWSSQLILLIIISSTIRSLRAYEDCKADNTYLGYRGRISYSKWRMPCAKWSDPRIRWDNEGLKRRVLKANRFPEGHFNHNYCRNPTNDTRGHWCVLKSSFRRSFLVYGWDFCDIPACRFKIVAQEPKPFWGEWENWSSCTSSCGVGVRLRRAICNTTSPTFGCPGKTPVESEVCTRSPCPPNAGGFFWSIHYGQWSACSHSCGGGRRRRKCSLPTQKCTGDPPYQQEWCNPLPCPRYENWARWGACSKTCNEGVRFRYRKCYEPRGRSELCEKPAPQEAEACNRGVPCGRWIWSQWSCSATCGNATRKRQAVCSSSEKDDCGEFPKPEKSICQAPPCPPPPWSQWSRCSRTCGSGFRFRSTSCDSRTSCKPLSQAIGCYSQACPTWARWSAYSQCSRTCGEGLQVRVKICSSSGRIDCPAPQPRETKKCRGPPCAHFGEWATWSPCSSSCNGLQIRGKICLGGRCRGQSPVQTRRCTCKPGWQQWSPWTGCSQSCAGGTRRRNRICNIPDKCSGASFQTQSCNIQSCSHWSNWLSWSFCSRSCNGGIKTRVKRCNPLGRLDCPGQYPQQAMPCNSHMCESVSAWGEWSACSLSCGDDGMRARVRRCLLNSRNECSHMKMNETKACQKRPPCRKPIHSCAAALTIPDTEGFLTSPQYPDLYPDRKDCRWYFQGPPGTAIGLEFVDFDLEESSGCHRDYFRSFYWMNGTPVVLAKYCGHLLPTPILSPSNALIVEFHSNHANRSGGFKAHYVIHPKGQPPEFIRKLTVLSGCGGPSFLNRKSGLIQSHVNFDGAWTRYFPNSNCTWIVEGQKRQMVKLEFLEFGLEGAAHGTCRYDKLTVYDGTAAESPTYGPWCGSIKPSPFVSSGRSLRIHFKSDTHSQQIGFRIRYTIIAPSGHTGNSTTCGKPKNEPIFGRVINGTRAIPGSWPWTAQIRHQGKHKCGAVLINSQWVLTAAHCIVNKPKQYLTVRLNGYSRGGQDGTTFKVKRILFHPKYNLSLYEADAALLELQNSAPNSDSVLPICLPKSAAHIDQKCVVVGWGQTLSTGSNQYLRQITVPIVSREQCNMPGWYNNQVTNLMLCAGYEQGGIDSCHGDSGSGLYCYLGTRWELAGIVSWGRQCALPRKPGIYVDVFAIKNWIHQKIM